MSITSVSCNVSIEEFQPPTPPKVNPDESKEDTTNYFHWYDLDLKTYNGKDIFIDRCYHVSPSHCSGRTTETWAKLSRYSDHQYISILSVNDTTITAQLNSGWFNVQYMPGCTKSGAVAVPRIIPTQNDMLITINTDKGKASFCDEYGNNICGVLKFYPDNSLIGIERNFYLNGYEKAYRRLTFISAHVTNPDFQFLQQNGTIDRTYHSFNGFGDIAEKNHFIIANWQSDIFNKLAGELLTIPEFFTYITNAKFLDTSEYFSFQSLSTKESMDRIMAIRFDDTQFYYNTNCVKITGHYKSTEKTNSITYDRLAINFVASDNENECLFYINPEILINGTTEILIHEYEDLAGDSQTSIDTTLNKSFPMHTPKSYDWNAEMLISLSPYTADGLRMKSDINTKEYGDKKQDYLTFSFSDDAISKQFAKAYLSILEDADTMHQLKDFIKGDSSVSQDKKMAILNILDNLNNILQDGHEFQISFQLFGDLRDAKYWDDPYVWW